MRIRQRNGTAKEHMSYEEWFEIGSALKQIDKENKLLWFESKLQPYLTKKEQRASFEQIDTGIRKLRMYLSECAFQEMSDNYHNPQGLSHDCFYDYSLSGKNEPHQL